MRKEFSIILHNKMALDEDIILLTGDLGYGLWDRIRIDYPDRFYNVGSSEQLMVAMACGMAMEGKKPVVYSITPFLLYRPFEIIRNYINRELLPVKLVGGGRDFDYGYLGFSHWAEEDRVVMNTFQNIRSYWPETRGDLHNSTDEMFSKTQPFYINLRRTW